VGLVECCLGIERETGAKSMQCNRHPAELRAAAPGANPRGHALYGLLRVILTVELHSQLAGGFARLAQLGGALHHKRCPIELTPHPVSSGGGGQRARLWCIQVGESAAVRLLLSQQERQRDNNRHSGSTAAGQRAEPTAADPGIPPTRVTNSLDPRCS